MIGTQGLGYRRVAAGLVLAFALSIILLSYLATGTYLPSAQPAATPSASAPPEFTATKDCYFKTPTFYAATPNKPAGKYAFGLPLGRGATSFQSQFNDWSFRLCGDKTKEIGGDPVLLRTYLWFVDGRDPNLEFASPYDWQKHLESFFNRTDWLSFTPVHADAGSHSPYMKPYKTESGDTKWYVGLDKLDNPETDSLKFKVRSLVGKVKEVFAKIFCGGQPLGDPSQFGLVTA